MVFALQNPEVTSPATSNQNPLSQSLPVRPEIPVATEENFKKEVLDSPVPVLVEFGAKWCAPCKEMKPKLQDLIATSNELYGVFVVDVDSSSALVDRFNITAVPTYIVFRDGKASSTVTGLQSLETLHRMLGKTSKSGKDPD
jgi:thioredoxin 1